MKSSVLLVDDHSIVRQGIAALLGAYDNLAIVGEAGNGADAVELARGLQPDLIVLDLLMPNTDSTQLIRTLRTVAPAARLAVLTSCDEDERAFAAIEAGAQAFLLKSMSGSQLLDAFERILADEVVIHPEITQRILTVVRRIRQPEENPFNMLSDRELDVLRALAHGASNARLAEELAISVKTVKTHVGSILAKLQLTDRTEAVAYAWRHGLMNP
jgi:DNA-binding NarL/FixJ family response regulator